MGLLDTSRSFVAYKASLADAAPLDREAERALARRFLAGDRRAGDELVRACLPFVISIAVQYRHWGVPLEDVIQQGNIGLLRAARKFDPERDVRLATYAAYWIRAEIREYVVRSFRVVRLGTTKAERKALRAYRAGECDAARLAELSGLTEERVALLLPLFTAKELSIDARADDTGAVEDRVPSPAPSPEEQASSSEQSSRAALVVGEALGVLSSRERLVVSERMMLDEPTTLQALGERLGVSKERVRQIEERAKAKLRERLASATLTPAA